MKPKSKKPYRVVCLGNVLVDILVKPVEKLPPSGGLLPVERVEMALGGCASNTAVALSRLGVSTSLWGKLGKDFFSEFTLKELRRSGVEVSGLTVDPTCTTSATVVLVDPKAQRSFLHSVAANDHIYRKDVKTEKFSRFDHLHIGGYFLFPALDGKPMADILRSAQTQGLTTSMDTAWDLKNRWMKVLKPCLPYLDYFMPSEREVKKLLGYNEHHKAARAFLKLGAKAIILKLGEMGCYYLDQDDVEIRVPSFKAKVVDTTGAGDSFCAGFIKGLSLGLDIKETLQLGNATGACAVEALGATAGIENWAQIKKKTGKV